MGMMMKRDLSGKALGGIALGFVMVVAGGCGTDAPKVIKAHVSAEDQQAAERSAAEHDSDEYAKSISEQNGPR